MRAQRTLFQLFFAILLLCLLQFPAAAWSQEKDGAPAAKKTVVADPYAGEPFIVKRLDVVEEMKADGTGSVERTMELKIQSEAAVKEFGVVAVQFASASQKVEIEYARVRKPDGSVLETPVSEAQEQPVGVTVQAPFYSDLKQKQLPIKTLQMGDTLEWKTRVVQTKAEAPNEFWGQEGFLTEDTVTLQESLELQVPAGMAVNVWTNPKAGCKPVESDAGGEHVYRWEVKNLTPTTGPEADKKKAELKKKVWTEDQESDDLWGELPSVAWSTFKDWEAVGAWYQKLEADRVVPDQSVKDKVAQLTAGKTSDEEKAKALYEYVATQVRYIGVAFGVGRYQPHHADEVLENGYGDCKDKHTLLAAMLTAAGLHPDAVLVGAKIRFNEAVPSPAAFNHLITHVMIGGKEVWLDSTTEVAPYEMLMRQIRGLQVLVVPETGVAKVEKTPEKIPVAARDEWTAAGTLNKDGVSDSHITLHSRGDSELMLRMSLRQVPPARYDQYVQAFFNGIGYSGTTSHPDITRPEDTADPFTISFDYHREGAGDWANFKIIPQLMPIYEPTVDENNPPVRSIYLGSPHTEESKSQMTLPEGWSAELPSAVHEKSPYMSMDLTYRFEHGTVYAERTLVVLQERVPVSDWKTYKKWQDAVSLGNETYIQLRGPVGAGAGKSATAAAPVSNEQAAKLVSDASTAIDRQNLAQGEKMLDAAKSLNPVEPNLWGTYGQLYWNLGDYKRSLAGYTKETELHPAAFWAYDGQVKCEFRLGNREAEEQKLRNWIAAGDLSAEPYRELTGMLLQDGDATGALDLAQQGLKHLPESKRDGDYLMILLARAEFKAGQKDGGAATIKTFLAATDDLEMTNGGAYVLAVANVDLPIAEAAMHKALQKMSEKSQGWTLNEDPDDIREQNSRLASSWDTLGWIYFQEGKLAEAENYVKAAWATKQVPVVGEHLGDIQLARHEANEALMSYELTQLLRPNAYTRDDSSAKDLKAKIEAAKKQGGKSQVGDKKSALLRGRTYNAGPAAGQQGMGDYWLILSQTGVEKVKPTGKDTVAGGEKMIEAIKLANFVPKDSDAKLVREAMLNCHENACELVFVP